MSRCFSVKCTICVCVCFWMYDGLWVFIVSTCFDTVVMAKPVKLTFFFFPCCMTHSASHAPMDFAIGGGYVQPQRSPREATIRWAFMPPDVSQGRGERRGLPIDAGCGRGREFEESLGQARCAATDRRPAQRCTSVWIRLILRDVESSCSWCMQSMRHIQLFFFFAWQGNWGSWRSLEADRVSPFLCRRAGNPCSSRSWFFS